LALAHADLFGNNTKLTFLAMSAFDPTPEEEADVDREIRIEKMKRELNDLAGGSMLSGSLAEVSPSLEETFLTRVCAFEKAPYDTNFNRLVQRGVAMVPPAELDEVNLHTKLQEVLRVLGTMRCFLEHTDHLSDRELYTWLWADALHEETPDLSQLGGAWHMSPIGGGMTETSPFSSNTTLARKNGVVGRQIFRTIHCRRIVLCLTTGTGVCRERSNNGGLLPTFQGTTADDFKFVNARARSPAREARALPGKENAALCWSKCWVLAPCY
jgi:hypothetical protein